MPRYPNQKQVTINKELSNKDNIYGIINRYAMNKAMNNLKLDGSKLLWFYMSMNQDLYTFNLSQKDVEKQMGIKIKKYYSAVNELIEKGYLLQRKESTEEELNYDFYELIE